ncbi:MAG: hypothetical protein R6U96_18220 [Promethearchaeia archaeon]
MGQARQTLKWSLTGDRGKLPEKFASHPQFKDYKETLAECIEDREKII